MPAKSTNHTIIIREIEDNIAVKQRMLKQLADSIHDVAEVFLSSLRSGGKIFFCGNGGSAADSQHLATELVVRLRASYPRPAIPAMALTVDTSTLTAAANDYGFEKIFSRQIEAHGRSGDVLCGISTSGNSANVIEAVKSAQELGLRSVAFLGGSGGKLKKMVDNSIIIPSDNTARIQEGHILVGHILCQLVEENLFPQS